MDWGKVMNTSKFGEEGGSSGSVNDGDDAGDNPRDQGCDEVACSQG